MSDAKPIDPDWRFHSGPICFVCGAQAGENGWFELNPPSTRRYWFCVDHWNEGVIFEGSDKGHVRIVVGNKTAAFVQR